MDSLVEMTSKPFSVKPDGEKDNFQAIAIGKKYEKFASNNNYIFFQITKYF